MYIQYPDLFESSAQLIAHGVNAKGIYLILNQSLFYPQGGGQPADQGIILGANAAYKVLDVRNVDGEVHHCIIDDGQAIHQGCFVTMKIDKDRRMINSKYHTAGHLIAGVAEKINPELKAIKGHQFPGEACIEFDGTLSNWDDFLPKITSTVIEFINKNAVVKTEQLSPEDATRVVQDLPYELPKDKALRVCHIAGFAPPLPCGGTHVKKLQDIAGLEIKKCKSKNGKTKIYYEVQ
jgi:alanyl-tRNA synthetase